MPNIPIMHVIIKMKVPPIHHKPTNHHTQVPGQRRKKRWLTQKSLETFAYTVSVSGRRVLQSSADVGSGVGRSDGLAVGTEVMVGTGDGARLGRGDGSRLGRGDGWVGIGDGTRVGTGGTFYVYP